MLDRWLLSDVRWCEVICWDSICGRRRVEVFCANFSHSSRVLQKYWEVVKGTNGMNGSKILPNTQESFLRQHAHTHIIYQLMKLWLPFLSIFYVYFGEMVESTALPIPMMRMQVTLRCTRTWIYSKTERSTTRRTVLVFYNVSGGPFGTSPPRIVFARSFSHRRARECIPVFLWRCHLGTVQTAFGETPGGYYRIFQLDQWCNR